VRSWLDDPLVRPYALGKQRGELQESASGLDLREGDIVVLHRQQTPEK